MNRFTKVLKAVSEAIANVNRLRREASRAKDPARRLRFAEELREARLQERGARGYRAGMKGPIRSYSLTKRYVRRAKRRRLRKLRRVARRVNR